MIEYRLLDEFPEPASRPKRLWTSAQFNARAGAEFQILDAPAARGKPGKTSAANPVERRPSPPAHKLLRRARETGSDLGRARPAAWDADSRARLRREAEAASLTLDLQPCQRVTDYALRYPHAPGK